MFMLKKGFNNSSKSAIMTMFNASIESKLQIPKTDGIRKILLRNHLRSCRKRGNYGLHKYFTEG